MSVVEYNLLSDKKPVPTRQSANGDLCADAQQKI